MAVLHASSMHTLMDVLSFAKYHRAETQIFWVFNAVLQAFSSDSLEDLTACMDEYPPLAYAALKQLLDNADVTLERAVRARLAIAVTQQVIRCANDFGVAALVALEKLAQEVSELELPTYCELLWSACHCIRAPQLVQEVLLVLNDCRESAQMGSPLRRYVHKHALGVVFDRMEDAGDTCPCDEAGRPKRQRISPVGAKLRPAAAAPDEAPPDETSTPQLVVADIRVDTPTPVRIHSHVRLLLSSPAEHSTLPAAVLDALVVKATRGELTMHVLQPLPPEYRQVNWRLYNAGSVATSKAMLDALQRFAVDGMECCRFSDIISGSAEHAAAAVQREDAGAEEEEEGEGDAAASLPSSLNASQREAVLSSRLGRMSLIWGPPGRLAPVLSSVRAAGADPLDWMPGTGKTTVVVQILLRFLRQDPEARVLMTASTHNGEHARPRFPLLCHRTPTAA